MAEQVTLGTFNTLQNSSIISTLNANNTLIENAFADCLSLSGITPNAMQSNLDMNSNQIINLPAPTSVNSPARFADLIPGIQGPIGLTGPQGPTGSTGPIGPQGPVGNLSAGGIISLTSVTNSTPVDGNFWFDGTSFYCRIAGVTYNLVLTPTPIPFSPTSLFSSNTGGWWDPSNHSTTFQDTAGTTPANAAGQPVARINDLSGNGNNLLQATNSKRPILQNSGAFWWLEFDGVSQFIGATFTLNQPTTRISAARQITWVVNNNIFDGGTLSGAALFQAFITPALSMQAGAYLNPDNDFTVGANHVVTEVYNGASSSVVTDNNVIVTGNAGGNNAGGFTIGASAVATGFTNIRWYGCISIGRLLTVAETANCRTFFGAKAGVTL